MGRVRAALDERKARMFVPLMRAEALATLEYDALERGWTAGPRE
jgi:hypothetical protein